ncbi:DUF1015 domain-containing protein [Streptomyces angustmyceticus]|uniref:Chromosome partitioning protein ParA n=1 Tax=Streptomyces angustmyceticus TaxID=285578 RepID=A0A5J4LFW4_9ACTN|nr:DUF1015 domain-containing protein [Streptomyces angustmyceticus]UAL69896.1 DUF1015 domain-containing protein [Streptomyces angustmyceticus]GES33037.1 hypothetical protein San01_55250 [Streptomyces angustmyceticus]
MTSTDGLRLLPFRGLRYDRERVGSLTAVTSPPYDVVVRPDGVRHLETADPYNIVRLILPHAADPTTRHRQAADTLRRWRSEGVLRQDAEPALYVYEQRSGTVLQRGLIGALGLDGPVLPHEGVIPEVVEDRAALMRAAAANFEPLLLSYRGQGTATGAAAVIERTVEREPLLATTTEDGFGHRLWAVTDPADLAAVDEDLAGRQALIADGHHRWATYQRLYEQQPGATAASPWAFGLVLLVDTARYPLQVRAIHRVLPHLPPAKALADLAGAFRARALPGDLPAALETLEETPGTAFVLAGGPDSFHLLDRPDPGLLERTIRRDRPEAWRRLDATVLHSVLLDEVWHIPDHPSDIGYLHHTGAAVEQAARHGGTAVLMRATSEETVRHLAERGVTMPRKSTSFGPKPATGLVLRTLDDHHN